MKRKNSNKCIVLQVSCFTLHNQYKKEYLHNFPNTLPVCISNKKFQYGPFQVILTCLLQRLYVFIKIKHRHRYDELLRVDIILSNNINLLFLMSGSRHPFDATAQSVRHGAGGGALHQEAGEAGARTDGEGDRQRQRVVHPSHRPRRRVGDTHQHRTVRSRQHRPPVTARHGEPEQDSTVCVQTAQDESHRERNHVLLDLCCGHCAVGVFTSRLQCLLPDQRLREPVWFERPLPQGMLSEDISFYDSQ